MKTSGQNSEIPYEVARVLAISTGAVSDSTRPTVDDTEVDKELAGEAVKVLQLAIQHGFRNFKQLRADPDFILIRDRDDFRKLLADLEASTQPSREANRNPGSQPLPPGADRKP